MKWPRAEWIQRSVMFRTQSPTNRKDLLVSQVRETMKAIKGSKQNWKQGINLSSLASSIQKTRKDRKDPAQLKGLGTGSLGARVREEGPGKEGAPRCMLLPGQAEAELFATLSFHTLYHLLWAAGSRPLRRILIARERRGAPWGV